MIITYKPQRTACYIHYILLPLACLLTACMPEKQKAIDTSEPLRTLAAQFKQPADCYKPYVWWHWMGSNFSKEGITKDLEAMKEAGIGGATIFNLASAVQETHAPTGNNPWPEQTFRSEAYWEALRHAASEAKRLGLKLGLQSTPGYSTSGGPWITEERGMQKIVSSQTNIEGGRLVETALKKPDLPVYKGWGSTHQQATYYRDVAVMAVPDRKDVKPYEVLDLSEAMDTAGRLRWQAPAGRWTVYRIGHAPTMSNPHPLPDELIAHALEADKMSKEQMTHHWQAVLDPLKEHLKEYIGDSFTHILIDSYEAGNQDWTPEFRKEFIRWKGYDPLPWIALRNQVGERADVDRFTEDYKEVVSRLYIDNGWKVAKEMINEAGLLFYWEPYFGPFDSYESVAIPDVPMGEFWTGSKGAVWKTIPKAARVYGKRIVAAEAFTGRPEISQYTEDPAFLKHSADGSFASGVNQLFLHHWVHQPFDDRYQPGMGMGWWGTHFGRHQTWIKPGKAFFCYLARCQMLLQQGTFISTDEKVLHRQTADADIYFIINPSDSVQTRTFAFAHQGSVPELWSPDKGIISRAADWRQTPDSVFVPLTLHPDGSVFLLFPHQKENGYTASIQPAIQITGERAQEINGSWEVSFAPKLGEPFQRELPALADFSLQPDTELRYFAGTATYRKTIPVEAEALGKGKRIMLDLGELNDIAELRVNGQEAGVLWHPPYQADITPWMKAGENEIAIAVTTNWANRLIGDEQYPADFEWGQDRGEKLGRAMKAYPEWFILNQPRPSKDRKTFSIWYYHRKDSPLQPAGLLGPVRVVRQDVEEINK